MVLNKNNREKHKKVDRSLIGIDFKLRSGYPKNYKVVFNREAVTTYILNIYKTVYQYKCILKNAFYRLPVNWWVKKKPIVTGSNFESTAKNHAQLTNWLKTISLLEYSRTIYLQSILNISIF